MPSGYEVVVCGGSDKKLRGYDATSVRLLFSMTLEAPVLSICCHDNFIAAAMMDGGIIVVCLRVLQS
jgi:hypothetical protein